MTENARIPVEPSDGSARPRNRGRVILFGVTVAAIVLWQVLMIPSIIYDAGFLSKQNSSAMLPIERLATSIVGAVGHGIHVMIWLFGSLVLVCFAAVVAWWRSR